MKVLVAEDTPASARLLERTLTRAGHAVVLTANGSEALDAIQREPFDALITDWMMPHMDGIELIRRVRAAVQPAPLILVVTALDTEDARRYALDTGADEYLTKPIDLRELAARLDAGYARLHQGAPATEIAVAPVPPTPPVVSAPARFALVCIAASTGGPPAVTGMAKGLSHGESAAYVLVQHGPAWMLEMFAQRLQRETSLNTVLARDGATIEPGRFYVAPGERHTKIAPDGRTLQVVQEPPENYVRPAADPLFRTAASTYGAACIGVVMTGMGRDGSLGAAQIAAQGGTVIVQSPASALVGSMPRTVLDLGIDARVVQLDDLAPAITEAVSAVRARGRGGQA